MASAEAKKTQPQQQQQQQQQHNCGFMDLCTDYYKALRLGTRLRAKRSEMPDKKTPSVII
jgi:hypothetical protein